MSDVFHNQRCRLILANVITAGVYILSGLLVGLVTHSHGEISLVFPPLGVALGFYLLCGSRILPGVFLGSCGLTFLFWFYLNPHPVPDLTPLRVVPVALAIALGAVLQTGACGYILRHWMAGANPLRRVRDLLVFVFVVGLAGSLIHANITEATLVWAGFVNQMDFSTTWLSGWLGDALGVLIVTPLFFVFQPSEVWKPSARQKVEAVGVAVLFYLGARAVFHNWVESWQYPMVLLLFPLLVWTAFRFREQGTVSAVAAVALLTAWGTGQEMTLPGRNYEEGILLVQVYLLGLTATTFLLSTLLSQSTHAMRQAAEFGRLLNQSFHEIYLIDPQTCRYLYANEGARQALGYTLEELQQMTPPDINPEFDLERVQQLFATMKNGGDPKPVFESVHLRKDGVTYPVEVRLQWTRIEGVECIVAVDIDISEKKQYQREIIAAREKAEQANRAKSAFLSSMSHEIRTPMNAILGYAQILDHDKKLNDTQRRKLGGIQKAGRHLLSLINDILDFSKIEAGKMELHPHDFSLSAMINDLYAIFRVRCDEKGIQLEMHHQLGTANQWVNGDEGKLRQVLINLLDNAVKYTDQGKIVFRITQKKNERYQFDIQDTGMGISPEYQEKIFQYFEQDMGGRERGGTGLGLTISKKLVKIMGGKLNLESRAGDGSRFHFSVPLVPAREKEPDSAGDYGTVTGLDPECRVRALVVDDNESNVDVLYEMLKAVGVEVSMARSGKEAIEHAGKQKPDIIFMDYKMPGLNGLEAARAIRHENHHSKIVMVTASSYRHERAKFNQEDIDGFVGKPFLRDEILHILRTVLNVKFQHAPEESEVETLTPEVFDPQNDFSSVRIPDFLLLNLKKMAKLGMIAEVEKQLAEVEKIKPEGPRLASHLKVLAQNYDKEGILKALDKVGHG